VDPETVLELIRSAPERYETGCAALRYQGDGATFKALSDRYLASEVGRHRGLPLDRLDLRVEGKTRKAGREAIRLVGVPVEEWQDFPEPLWWGADEY
jgi:hypothetical protein